MPTQNFQSPNILIANQSNSMPTRKQQKKGIQADKNENVSPCVLIHGDLQDTQLDVCVCCGW
jgi:hypothetical protein